MNRYVLSVAAELDLDQIWEFIAQDNIDAADRWIEWNNLLKDHRWPIQSLGWVYRQSPTLSTFFPPKTQQIRMSSPRIQEISITSTPPTTSP